MVKSPHKRRKQTFLVLLLLSLSPLKPMEEKDSSSSPLTPTNPTPIFRSPADISRRTRSFSSMSSSPSSSSSHLSSPFTPPSPFSSFSSSIPFSWERQPGIPKTSPTKPTSPNPTLPLPPLLRPPPTRKKRPKSNNHLEQSFVRDPFAVALMECSKEENTNWKMASSAPAPEPICRRRGRRSATSLSDRFGLGFMSLDLYASCKTTCSVADSNVHIPRSSRAAMPVYGRLKHRPE